MRVARENYGECRVKSGMVSFVIKISFSEGHCAGKSYSSACPILVRVKSDSVSYVEFYRSPNISSLGGAGKKSSSPARRVFWHR